MSDTTDLNPVDEEYIVSPDEAVDAENFDLRTLGIDPATTPIATLLSIYRDQVAICNAYSEKLKSNGADPTDVTNVIKAKLKATIKADSDSSVKDLRTIGEAMANDLFIAPLDLTASAVMLEELAHLLDLMRDEYNYHFNAEVQAKKDELGIVATPAESAVRAKLACIKLKGVKPGEGLINARLAMAKVMDDEASIPANLYKTGGIRGGFNTDLLPRLPRLSVEGGAQVGSPSTHLVFRFMPAEFIVTLPGDGALGEGTIANEANMIDCSETTLNDVAHNVVSSGAYRVTGKQVSADLKAKGHGIGATENEWKLEYRTGTLFGKKA